MTLPFAVNVTLNLLLYLRRAIAQFNTESYNLGLFYFLTQPGGLNIIRQNL